jgi:TolB-like protein
MKNRHIWTICILSLFALVQPSWAKEKSIVGVLPFSVHSAENIDYIRQGIGDMISSRLSVNEKIEIVAKDVILAAQAELGAKELTPADVYGLGKKLDADFMVWGSITKIGNSLNIDGKLVDIAAYKSPVVIFTQFQSMDEIIPKITDFAQRIETHIVGAPSQAFTSPAPSKEIIVSRQQPTPETAREAQIISGMKGNRQGTYTSSINPDFINAEQPIDRKTFWKSQQFPNEFRGMDIGDVNGDGLNETVLIDSHTVLICQKKGDEFKQLQQIQGKSYDNYISVDIADVNQNGIKEIFVSSYAGAMVDSFVIEFKNGKFEIVASDLRWFLRALGTDSGTPLLIGQRRGMEKTFDTPIHEIAWEKGEYRLGRKMRIPEGLSIYGLAMDRLGSSGPEKIIALNDNDYLCIFEQTDKPLNKVAVIGGSDEFIWKSDDVYGGSNTYIDPVNRTASSERAEDISQRTYINLRILVYDTNNDGKREIIIVKNTSASARVLQRFKLFTSSEVLDLEWEGTGMVENWRTRKISGYVADYQFKDIDNDGDDEVVLALVLSVGGTLRERSVVVAYDLKGQ